MDETKRGKERNRNEGTSPAYVSDRAVCCRGKVGAGGGRANDSGGHVDTPCPLCPHRLQQIVPQCDSGLTVSLLVVVELRPHTNRYENRGRGGANTQ